MSVEFARHWFTVGDYERMGKVGILPHDKRFELIRGEIIEMSPIGKRHAACVNYLSNSLSAQLGQTVIVSVKNPIVLDDFSEPQPDVVLLKPRADFYRNALPKPEDVLLVIEVSDSTLEFDRRVKVSDYARTGIPELLIFNLPDEQLEYHAQPANDAYKITRTLKRGERLQSSSVPGAIFDVAEILG